MSEWQADIHITDEFVRNSLHDQFPSLSIQQIKCIGEGWDNAVFLVNEKIIFRIPRREVAVELLERENKILKNLQLLFTLEIPNPIYIADNFQGYNLIEGISGCHAQLSSKEREESLPILATFLKKLHSIKEAQALAIGAQPQIWDRTNVKQSIKTLTERVNKIIEQKLCHINLDIFRQELIAAEKIHLPFHKCLIHGDLYCRHLMFNQGKLTGIIDWGDVGINNPSVDLSVIWSFYPSSCHENFFEIYGKVDSTTWQYARFLGLYSALTLVFYGHNIGDTLLVVEAMNSIKRINKRLII